MLRALLVMVMALVISGCAHGPRVVNLSSQELSSRLEREFPIDRRWLEVFDVHVAAPRISSEPAEQRLRADFQVRAQDRLSGRRLEGRLALVAGLRWEPADGTLRLQRVDLDLPPRSAEQGAEANAAAETLRRLGLVMAGRLLEDQVVWRAPAGAPLAVQRVTVTASGLELAVAR